MRREDEDTGTTTERVTEGTTARSDGSEQLDEIIRALWSINDALRSLVSESKRPQSVPGMGPNDYIAAKLSHNHYLRDHK